MPLVINSPGRRHTHTYTHTQTRIPTIHTGSFLRNQAPRAWFKNVYITPKVIIILLISQNYTNASSINDMVLKPQTPDQMRLPS